DRGSAAARETRDVLAYALEASLRLLHPFVPFITEELWQRVPRPADAPASIVLARFPDEAAGRRDPEALRDMAALQAIITAARTIRSEHEIHPGAEVPLMLRADDDRVREVLEAERAALRLLVKTAGEPVIERRGGERPRGAVMSLAGGAEVLVSLR